MYDYILKKGKVWWDPTTWDEDECRLVLGAVVCVGSIVLDCVTKSNTKRARTQVIRGAKATGKRLLLKARKARV